MCPFCMAKAIETCEHWDWRTESDCTQEIPIHNAFHIDFHQPCSKLKGTDNISPDWSRSIKYASVCAFNVLQCYLSSGVCGLCFQGLLTCNATLTDITRLGQTVETEGVEVPQLSYSLSDTDWRRISRGFISEVFHVLTCRKSPPTPTPRSWVNNYSVPKLNKVDLLLLHPKIYNQKVLIEAPASLLEM